MNTQERFERDYQTIESMPIERRNFLRGGIGAALTYFAGKANNAVGDEHVGPSLKELWDKQTPAYEKIAAVGIQQFYDDLGADQKKQLFLSEKELHEINEVCSCCSDERLKNTDNKTLLIRIPGSGILLATKRKDKDPFAPEFIESTAKHLFDLGVTTVAGHLNCGAANVVFKERILYLRMQGNHEEANRIEKLGFNEWNHQWVEAVSICMNGMVEKLKVPHGKQVQPGFIEQENLKGPHFGRGLALLVERDDYNAANTAFPPLYVERVDNMETALSDMVALAQIALNREHAVGNFIDARPENQFILMPIAKTRQRLDRVIAHAENKRLSLGEDGKKMRVEGLIA